MLGLKFTFILEELSARSRKNSFLLRALVAIAENQVWLPAPHRRLEFSITPAPDDLTPLSDLSGNLDS